MLRHRYTLRRLFSEFLEATLAERGLLFTLREMSLRPGVSLQAALSKTPSDLLEPIKFLLICVAAAVVALSLTQFDKSFGDFHQLPEIAAADETVRLTVENLQRLADDEQSNVDVRFRIRRAIDALRLSMPEYQMQVMMQWMNLLLLPLVPAFALATWLCFPRGFNFAEHFVINAYVYGVQCIISVVLFPLNVWGYFLYTSIYFLVAQAYQFWAWHQIFRLRSWWEWVVCTMVVLFIFLVYAAAVSLLSLLALLLTAERFIPK